MISLSSADGLRENAQVVMVSREEVCVQYMVDAQRKMVLFQSGSVHSGVDLERWCWTDPRVATN